MVNKFGICEKCKEKEGVGFIGGKLYCEMCYSITLGKESKKRIYKKSKEKLLLELGFENESKGIKLRKNIHFKECEYKSVPIKYKDKIIDLVKENDLLRNRISFFENSKEESPELKIKKIKKAFENFLKVEFMTKPELT